MSEKDVVTMEYENGEYTGEVVGEIPHGQGKLAYPDGSYYEGEWENGCPHGLGKAKCYDDDGEYMGYFEGEFVNGDFKHGKWRERNSDYEGDFVDGLFDGYGVKKWDCSLHYYEGQWKQGLYHGKGICCDYDGTWDGEWKDGHINGSVTLTSKDGWVFVGEAVESFEIKGKGTMTFENGDVYVGEVASSYDSLNSLRMHGEGTYTCKDGSVYKGKFVWGRRKEVVDAEIRAKKEEERRQEEARLEAERREAEERAKDPVAYDARKKREYREYLEEKCKVLYGGTTDISRRFSILREAYFQSHNSGFNDHMAWEASTGRYDADIEFWDNACRLKYEVEALCNIYKEELEG